jgi:3',5'-cyclic AMP phosphodiesterase CpdA
VTTLLQISDTHFGTEQAPVTRALLELNRELRPDVVVLSGDITQRARRSQFAAARAFIDLLSPPQLVSIPGNHDIPLFNLVARTLYPYANYSRYFGHNLEPELETDSLLILGVNTTRPRRHTDGELSSNQIARVSARLARASKQQLRIVVTHQPVHVIRDSDITNLLHGHDAAVHSWSAAGADIVMGGHIHLPYVRPLSDRFGDLSRRIWSVQAGTAVSSRIRRKHPNSVNVLRWPLAPQVCPASQICKVERWEFDAGRGAFRMGEVSTLDVQR